MQAALRLNARCPCNSGHEFGQCCRPYITAGACPLHADVLMRSRYSAYTLAKINYIEQTQAEAAAKDFDSLAAKRWAKRCKWLKLDVVDFIEDYDAGAATVSFVARYNEAGNIRTLQERSVFKRIAGKWYYVSGDVLEG